jgi:hypothetical protein
MKVPLKSSSMKKVLGLDLDMHQELLLSKQVSLRVQWYQDLRVQV